MTYIKRGKNDNTSNIVDTFCKVLDQQNEQRINEINEVDKLKLDLDYYKKSYESVTNSNIWKYSGPIRKILDNIKRKRNSINSTAIEDIICDDGNIVYEDEICFDNNIIDIKAIALYLPSFYETKENNKFWGKGFTEWNNVNNGSPRFNGHNQPRIPNSDIGYYNNDKAITIKKQVDLAKKHGLYGFCFYYYEFSGKKILNKPIDIFCENKEIDFNYMLTWANENWTRSWSGDENNVILRQKYKIEDAVKFIKNIKKYLLDDRYIKIEGRPVIGIYRIDKIPNYSEFVKKIRETAKEEGIGDLYILGVDNCDLHNYCCCLDGVYEFPPAKKGKYVKYYIANTNDIYYSYKEYLKDISNFSNPYSNVDYYRGIMLEWDNSSRRRSGANLWIDYSSEYFYLVLRNIIEQSKRQKEDRRFIFINAWNEWGEGTYLEPDSKRGYANINALSKALYGYDFDYSYIRRKYKIYPTYISNNEITLLKKTFIKKKPKIAIQVHIFYIEYISRISKILENIKYPYDLFITVVNEEYINIVKSYFSETIKANQINVKLVKNEGRDVMPFINQMKDVINEYEYICHLHTKKSLHSNYGNEWSNYLYTNLLGSEDIVNNILLDFTENSDIGLVYPDVFEKVKEQFGNGCGVNVENTKKLIKELNIKSFSFDDEFIFPAGNMFWARTGSIKNIFELDYSSYDVAENDQVDGTIMHAIERIWSIIAKNNGYKTITTRSIYDNCSYNLSVSCSKNDSVNRFLEFCKTQNLNSQQERIVHNVSNRNYLDSFNYDFLYNSIFIKFDLIKDKNGMYYVMYKNKKMYLNKTFDRETAINYVRQIHYEQDEESPHLYITKENNKQLFGDIAIDCGAAEGFVSLDLIDRYKELYIVECDDNWLQALRETFKPYKNVHIIKAMISNKNKGLEKTIDSIVKGKESRVNMIKMDIEGCEVKALEGMRNTLSLSNDLTMFICAYHNQNDEQQIMELLSKYKFTVNSRNGYILFNNENMQFEEPYFRRGVIECSKKIMP